MTDIQLRVGDLQLRLGDLVTLTIGVGVPITGIFLGRRNDRAYTTYGTTKPWWRLHLIVTGDQMKHIAVPLDDVSDIRVVSAVPEGPDGILFTPSRDVG